MKRLLVFILIFFAGKTAFAQLSDTSLWIPNGPVRTVLLHDSLLYVGGDFTQVSPITGHFVSIDSSSAAVVYPIPQVNGKVNCMARDSAGYTYVGGLFGQVGSFSCANLFRLTPQGNFDPTFITNPDDEVNTLYVNQDILYVGGNFQNIDGIARKRGAAFSVTESYDTVIVDTVIMHRNVADTLLAFDAGSNGPIYAFCADTLTHGLIVGGSFTNIGGAPNFDIAKLDWSSGTFIQYGNSAWTAVPQINGAVRSIKIVGSKIFIGGDFTAFATTQRKGLAVLAVTSGYLLNFDAGMNGTVRDIEVLNNNLYFGGNFSVVDGNFRSNLACVDQSLNLLPWNPSSSGPIYDLSIWDSTAFCVGGNFKFLGIDSCYYAGIIDTNGFVHVFNPKFDAAVNAVMPAFSGGKFWAGGDFTGAGGVLRDNFCAININTKRPNNWAPKFNNTVTTLYADNTQLYVAGDFSTVSNQLRGRLCSFDIATNALTTFNPIVNGYVRTIAEENSQLFIGGNFSLVGTTARNNIASIDIATSQAASWNPGCAGTVNKIILDGDYVYIGGFFTQAGGQMRQNLARISATTALADFSWSCDEDNGIYDMNLYNGQLFIGGWFQHAANQTRNYFAAVDTSSGNLLAFNPTIDNYIRGMERYNGDFFLSGAFLYVNGIQQRSHLCNYDFANGNFSSWAPQPDVFPESMQVSQNWLYIGGSFINAGYRYHPYLAMIDINSVTGIAQNNLSENSGMEVWPNPAGDFVFVSLPNQKIKTVEVMNVDGQMVKEETDLSGNGISQIDLSFLSAGMYFVKVTCANGIVVNGKVTKN
jgi:hypothetical protein